MRAGSPAPAGAAAAPAKLAYFGELEAYTQDELPCVAVPVAVVAVRRSSLEVNQPEQVYYISQAWSTLEQGCFSPDI
jgi:hypothetical protein